MPHPRCVNASFVASFFLVWKLKVGFGVGALDVLRCFFYILDVGTVQWFAIVVVESI